jgi:hypothetical protein
MPLEDSRKYLSPTKHLIEKVGEYPQRNLVYYDSLRHLFSKVSDIHVSLKLLESLPEDPPDSVVLGFTDLESVF